MYRVTWVSAATSDPMGQQRYEREIQAALRRVAGPEWSFELVTVTSVRSGSPGAKRMSGRLTAVAPLTVSRAFGRVLYGSPDLVHRFDLRLPAAWGREVVTVHDLPPLRFTDEGRLARSSAAGARRALGVIVPSRFAGEDLARLIGVPSVEVVPYGVSEDYRHARPATDDELNALGVSSPFILHAAGASERKNLAGLADAWRLISQLHSELALVLCGPTDARRDKIFCGALRVVKPGRLESSAVAALMRCARAVIVPSTYEGFGLPALEAMACGVPLVAARRGALPEVCGDAAVLVEPDGEAIAGGVDRVLRNPIFAEELVKRGRRRASKFSWDAAADEHLRVYRKLVAIDISTARRPRQRRQAP